MKILEQIRKLWPVLISLTLAFLLLIVTLLGLDTIHEAAAAPNQDDTQGQWTDTLTETAGLVSMTHTVVNTTQGRLELDLASSTLFTQTDWSGGSNQSSTSDTSTHQYNSGVGINPLVSGDLSLGFTLPASDNMAVFAQDSYPDLVITSLYSGTIGSGGSYAEESYLYYGSAAGFSDTNRTVLPVDSATANTVADLNNDGFLDITVSRGNEINELNGPTYIFWGGSNGYSDSNRTELPSNLSTCSVNADLNQDGYLDIVLCNYIDASLNFFVNSYIYWGSSTGYAVTNHTDLPTVGSIASYAADFNQDGYLDLVFSNYQNSLTKTLTTTYVISSYVYWGSATGYETTNLTELPTIGAYGNSVADLNRDGYLDIVFSNRRTGGLDTVTSTYALNSYIYWGSSTGFTETNRLELPTLGSYGNSVADLNGDDYPEIIFSNHYDGLSHNINSYIYWNDAGTFTESNRTELPTIGATGNCVGDLNHDGYPDIVFPNRRSGDNHDVPSYIYWGSSSGEYATTNRTSLNTHGAIGCSFVGGTIASANTAYGNIYAIPITGATTITDTAITPLIYPTTGVLTSTGFDAGQAHIWHQISWHASIITGTDIALDVATSNDGLNWSAWTQAAASSVDGANNAILNVAQARFIRYRATLLASADHRQTPVLHDIQLTGQVVEGSATSVSITPAVLDRWDVVTWTAQITGGQALTLQVLDSSNHLIPDTALPGNSSGFDSSPLDISTLSVSSYPSLRLRAWLRSDIITTTPSLDDWSVTWFAPAFLTISPTNATRITGESISYTVIAHDNLGQIQDVTSNTGFMITSGAKGVWNSNVYTSATTGLWTITGSYKSLFVTTTLMVQNRPVASVTITPTLVSLDPGVQQTFTATGYDSLGSPVSGLNFVWSVQRGGAQINSMGATTVSVTSVVTDSTYANTVVATSTNGITGAATIVVNNMAPTANISGSSEGDTGTPINFSGSGMDSNNDPLTYTWTFGDGGIGTGMLQTHTYDQEGAYNVVLTVTDDNNAMGVSTHTITIGSSDSFIYLPIVLK